MRLSLHGAIVLAQVQTLVALGLIGMAGLWRPPGPASARRDAAPPR